MNRFLDVEEELIDDSFNPYDQGTLSGDKDGYAKLVTKKAVLTQQKTDELKASLTDIRDGLDEMFSEVKDVGSFSLSEIKVVLEVRTEGGFALVGSLKAGVKGGVTLTFSPNK